MKKPILSAVCTLVGFTIGAGILGIPFVVAKSGFFAGMVNIIVIGILILMLNLCLGEITLRTKGIHQLTGYAKIYLGNKGYIAMIVIFTLFSYGALMAYIIKIGEFLSDLFSPIFGGSQILYATIFFLLMFFIIYGGLKFVERSEVSMVFVMLALLILLMILAIPKASIENLSNLNKGSFFLPYGVVLFAFAALPAIPSLNEELNHSKKELKKVIMIGSIIPIVIYALFATIVVAVSGVSTTDAGIIGLAHVLGEKVLVIGAIFGILTMATSFIAVAFAVKEMFYFDYKVRQNVAAVLSCIIPFIASVILLNTNIKDLFFEILDITGTFGGSLEGILVVLIWLKAKKIGRKNPEYDIKGQAWISWILILMFILGTLYQLKDLFLGFT